MDRTGNYVKCLNPERAQSCLRQEQGGRLTGKGKKTAAAGTGWRAFAENAVLRAAIGLALLLPHRVRVPLFGFLGRAAAPLAGYHRRIRENLAHVLPDLPEAEVRTLCRAVPDNALRTLIENYATRDLMATGSRTPVTGPGLPAMEAARAKGQPILFVGAHFGNYEVPRAALIARGWKVSGLYRSMENRYFNAHYVRTMEALGPPVFPRGRRGTAGLVRYLSQGGAAVLLIDQYFRQGAALDFFGKPAPTALSAAELALKYGALLVPFYGIRQPDGLRFEAVFEAPIPHSDPWTMTQAVNDSLEARVRAHMGQWFWIHRRWKPGRQARYPATRNRPD